MSHLATPWHCWLDRLGRAVVILVAVLGCLYVSAYTVGWPNLPDPDKQFRKTHGQHVPKHTCPNEIPTQ